MDKNEFEVNLYRGDAKVFSKNKSASRSSYSNGITMTTEELLDEVTKKTIDDISNNIANSIKDSFIKFYENIKYNDEMTEVEKIKNANEYNIFESLAQAKGYNFDTNRYTVKSKLKAVLKKNGIKQKALVMATGINRGTISNIINSPESASLINILKICKVLGMKVEDLFDLEKTMLLEEILDKINDIEIISEDDYEEDYED